MEGSAAADPVIRNSGAFEIVSQNSFLLPGVQTPSEPVILFWYVFIYVIALIAFIS